MCDRNACKKNICLNLSSKQTVDTFRKENVPVFLSAVHK